MLCTLAVGCGPPPPILPPPPNDFVSEFFADRIGDSQEVSPLTDTVEIREGEGVFVQFGLQFKDPLPTDFEERPVVPPFEFPMMLVIYPRDSDVNDARALRGGVRVLDRPGQQRRGPLLNDIESPHWFFGGRRGKKAPNKPVSKTAAADWKAGKSQWYWSYLCVDRDQSGEFIFEVWLLPTAHWLSSVRFDYGPPVVLKRGLLRVTPASEVPHSEQDVVKGE